MNVSSILPLLHVLVIDDDPDARGLLCRTLARHRVGSVVPAKSVQDSLRLVQASTNEINLILCDWNLPGVSGLDFCRMIKTQKPNLPIVMVTGRSDFQSIRQARAIGVEGYLVKPVAPDELLQKISAVADRARATSLIEAPAHPPGSNLHAPRSTPRG